MPSDQTKDAHTPSTVAVTLDRLGSALNDHLAAPRPLPPIVNVLIKALGPLAEQLLAELINNAGTKNPTGGA